MNQLNENAASFINFFENHQNKMQQSLLDYKRMSTRLKELQRHFRVSIYLGVFIGLLGIIVGIAHIFDVVPQLSGLLISCVVFMPVMIFCEKKFDEATYVKTANSTMK